MDQTIIENISKRLTDLEKRIEDYFRLLEITNELDFVLKGKYLLDEQIESVMQGNY